MSLAESQRLRGFSSCTLQTGDSCRLCFIDVSEAAPATDPNHPNFGNLFELCSTALLRSGGDWIARFLDRDDLAEGCADGFVGGVCEFG